MGKPEPEQNGLPAARKREYVRPLQSVLIVIPIIGFSVCAFVLVSVDAAHKQIVLLERWWIRRYIGDLKRRDLFDVAKLTDHPPINGMFDARIYKCLSTKWLPVPVIVGWVALASAVVIEYVLTIDRGWFWVAGVTTAIMLGLLGLYIALGQDTYRSEEPPAARARHAEPGAAPSPVAGPVCGARCAGVRPGCHRPGR